MKVWTGSKRPAPALRAGAAPGCPDAALVASMIGYYTLVGAAGLSAIFLH